MQNLTENEGFQGETQQARCLRGKVGREVVVVHKI